jgi:hypothetical protein
VNVRRAREAVYERARGRCEKCGYSLHIDAWECHHRQLRSQGGTWTLPNLLALHPDCHSAGAPGSVHHGPAAAYAAGFLVSGYAEPEATPVLLYGRRWVRLTATGDYEKGD